jgi:hypothetical protein
MKRIVVAALCSLLFAVSGFAQFQTGNIYGKVQAKDGSLLPGVTVTLSGVGAPITTVTDAQGNFRFVSLSPGQYTLKADLAGYGNATRAGVGVRVGSNSDVTMSLNPSINESITVTAEAPLLDVRKAGTAINVTKVELEKIPTSRDPWTILQQAPSVQVDRINVGGNQSGQQSVYLGKGAGSRENTWNVDGVNITDEGATGSSPTYYDFDSFEEMQVTTGGSDPRIQTPGVQLNMVTKRGTNDFKGSGRYFYTPGSTQSDPTVPAEAVDYLQQTNAINYVRDYGAELGGPLWRDKLWFWAADSDNKISNQNSLRVGDTPGFFDNIILRNKNAKLNAQILPSNSAVGFYSNGDKVRNARSLSPTRPFETALRQTGPTTIYKLEDTQIFGSSLYLTGMWSKVTGGFGLIPNGGIGPNVPNAYRDTSNVWHNTFSFYETDRPQKQYRIDGSKFLDIGSMNHELKFGFGYRNTPVSSSSGWPGSTSGFYRFRSDAYCNAQTVRGVVVGPGCAQAKIFRDANKAYDEKYNDFYVGDTILLGNLTVQAGLRWDAQKSRNLASSSPSNPVLAAPLTLPFGGSATAPTIAAQLPAISFGGDTRDLKWNSISPRIGFTYALGADKATLLRAGYNRYVSQMGATVTGASPFTYYSYFTMLGRDLNGDKIIQRNELLKIQGYYYIDAQHPASTAAQTRLDYGMKPPHSDEIILGAEHELMTDFSVGVNYSYRRYQDLLETRAEKGQGSNNFYTSADYVPGGTTNGVTYYLLKPGIDPPVNYVIRNRPDYSQSFNGLELTATKRLSHKWMLRGNLSLNDWKQHAGSGSYADPTPTVRTGYNGCYGNCGGQVFERSAGSGAFNNVFINSKWSMNVTGLYQLPLDFNIGASLTARQGYPRIERDVVDVDNGTDTVILNTVGTKRFSNVYELDLRAAKDFRFANRVGLTLSADMFNVPNKRSILQRETDMSLNFGEITEMQSPRVWRLGMRLSF